MEEKYRIDIEILDKTFPVKVSAEEEPRIRVVAQYIQDKVNHYKNQYQGLDALSIAVMACMDITSDYLSASEQHEVQQAQLTKRLSELIDQTAIEEKNHLFEN